LAGAQGDVQRSGFQPHAFFWLVLLALAVGVTAAWSLNPGNYAYALNSTWVHRTEVGLAAFAVTYLVCLLLWLAYHGKAVRRVELPGGTAVEAPDALDAAAQDFEEFERKTEQRFSEVEDWLADLDARLSAVEGAASTTGEG
jgi:hypothetical protein